jgi:hypothetical protein
MKHVFYLIILAILFSCEPNKSDEIIAGVINNNLNYIEISPPMLISNPGKDSIDLNDDSKFDIIFIKSPEPLLTGFAIKTEIIKKTNVQIILSNINGYPDTLNYKDLINESRNWSGTEEKKYVLQSFNCNSNNCPSIGNFINVTNKYIGFKIEKSFGWILLDNSIWSELKIRGFAINK